MYRVHVRARDKGARMIISDRELRDELLHRCTYDAARGEFHRRAGFTGVKAGALLGCLGGAGALQATFLGKRYQVAHLVWLVEVGELPNRMFRKNGDASDDRFCNLTMLKKPLPDFGLKILSADGDRVRAVCDAHGEFSRKAENYRQSPKGCPDCGSDLQSATPEQRRATKDRANAKRREKMANRSPEERERYNAAKRAYFATPTGKWIQSARAARHYQKVKFTDRGKAARICRQSMNRLLHASKGGKTADTVAMQGYTIEEFKAHIEGQFLPWMTWGNHGRWHVDHIVPLQWLLDHGVKDPWIVNALDNLRPLEHTENRSRSKSP